MSWISTWTSVLWNLNFLKLDTFTLKSKAGLLVLDSLVSSILSGRCLSRGYRCPSLVWVFPPGSPARLPWLRRHRHQGPEARVPHPSHNMATIVLSSFIWNDTSFFLQTPSALVNLSRENQAFDFTLLKLSTAIVPLYNQCHTSLLLFYL